jgi:hypothetical protein
MLAMVLVPTVASAQTAEPTDRGVILRQRIDGAYQASLAGFSRLLNNPVEARVKVKPGDTLSGLIAKLYQVGPHNGSDAAAALADKISATNGLDPRAALRAGDTLTVPVLPPIALAAPGANPANKVPKLSIDPRLVGGASDTQAPTLGSGRIAAAGRPAAQYVLQYDLVATADAKQKIAEDKTTSTPGDRKYDVVSAPLQLIYADAPGAGSNGSGAVFDDKILATLKSHLAAPAKQRPVLYVFDDAWADGDRSRALLVAELKAIWSFNHLGAPPIGAALLAPPSPPHAGSHAVEIAQALAPLEAQEPTGGRVDVVYLPLIGDGDAAREAIVQLILLNQVMVQMANARGDAPPPDLVKNSLALARSIVARLVPPSGDFSHTDVAVVNAALRFATYYTEATGQPFFVNMSWTLHAHDFDPVVPDDYLHGVFVAAAGNEGPPKDQVGASLYELFRQFAYRSRAPGDVLAVMNVTPSGERDCGSTDFGPVVADDFVASFAGRVSETICGTSFSAPRVPRKSPARLTQA